MYHSGIGGGGLALVRSSKGTYESVNFRETAPAAADMDMFKNNLEASLHGGLASGVPGQLRGLEYIHSQYGSLPWKDVVHPAVNLARNGFTVSETLLQQWGFLKPTIDAEPQSSTAIIDFLRTILPGRSILLPMGRGLAWAMS